MFRKTPNAARTNKVRLFVDMDGTLCKWKSSKKFEDLLEEGFFLDMEENQTVVEAVKDVIRTRGDEIEVFVLSAALAESRYAISEKNAWLDRHIPEIPTSHRVFSICGTPKLLSVPNGARATDVLLDDYTKNLLEWGTVARGVKLCNGINDTRGTWTGPRVYASTKGSALATAIADCCLR